MLEVNAAVEVDCVGSLQNDAKHHVSDAKDDRGLHLEAVEEGQVILTEGPNRIESELVEAVRLWLGELDTGLVSAHCVVTAAENICRNAHEVVVEEPAVSRKQAHEKEGPAC